MGGHQGVAWEPVSHNPGQLGLERRRPSGVQGEDRRTSSNPQSPGIHGIGNVHVEGERLDHHEAGTGQVATGLRARVPYATQVPGRVVGLDERLGYPCLLYTSDAADE